MPTTQLKNNFNLLTGADGVTPSYRVNGNPINANNNIVINDPDEFAVQDDTTITLEEGKSYFRGASFTTPKRFIVEPNVAVWAANASEANVWESTTTGTMFTGVDVQQFDCSNLSARCPNGQIFDFLDTTPQTSVILIDRFIGRAESPGGFIAQKFGTFTDLITVQIMGSSASLVGTIEDGVTIAGTLSVLSISEFAQLSTSASFIALDLGTSVIDIAFEIKNMITLGVTPGSIGISGLANSGNIGANIIGTITGSEFLINTTPLVGVSRSDQRLEFKKSTPVIDSSTTADTYLTSSQTVTIGVGNQGTFFPIGGANWSSDVSERFTASSSGLLTYVGLSPTETKAMLTATVEKVGGGSDEIDIGISVNGAVPDQKTISSTENNAPTSVVGQGIYLLENGDTIQGYTANAGGTSNVIVSKASLDITNGF